MSLSENALALRREVDGALKGRQEKCEILAVTKTHSADEINPLFDMGFTKIGENRVQELLGKLPELDSRFEIHLIGQLQTNKVKYIMDCVSMIHSVDRPELLKEIDRRAREHSKVMDILIEVSIAGEEQKGGCPIDELPELAAAAQEMSGVRLRGLMTMMPLADDPETLRPYFKKMRSLFDGMKASINSEFFDTLSMGMSRDCIVAAEEGATLLRVGTRLFGARKAV
ncbi:MAG: YggS family pyridoxal phosphate-dependent enzyme [Eubacteriales bacterium]|nr:YggS family pyridoxal phosphate-dependent enzyme [Eubacteriales bacterium]MDD3881700.1 YggS family pyridoxal phosphate-dependent enzyme [Eubacteriales bacterium]MDD4512241.1 YggS family pyridoxal phosphate-dependent enzyme [Eubacteriales bacterium]